MYSPVNKYHIFVSKNKNMLKKIYYCILKLYCITDEQSLVDML